MQFRIYTTAHDQSIKCDSRQFEIYTTHWRKLKAISANCLRRARYTSSVKPCEHCELISADWYAEFNTNSTVESNKYFNCNEPSKNMTISMDNDRSTNQ